MFYRQENNHGFVVVEALLSASILVIFFVAFLGIVLYNQKAYDDFSNRQRAIQLAEEGVEAVRNIRDADFNSLSDGSYGISSSSGTWTLVPSSDNIDIFNRQISISTISSDIKQISSSVKWESPSISQSVLLTTYLTNWAVLEESDVCWDNPFIESGLSVGTCASGSEVVVQGDYAYMVKAGTSNFSIIDISNTANPSLVGSCTNSNCSLSATLQSIAVQGDYAYITSTTNGSELYTVDISNKSNPRRVRTYDAPGNGDGRTLWIDNGRLYMTRNYGSNTAQYELLVFSLDNPSNPSLLGGLNIENTCTDIVVSGNYAYLACSDTSREFQVVDVSNPSNMSLSKRYALNIPGSNTGWALTMLGSVAFIGMNNGLIYSVNISNPQSPSIISSYDFDGDVNKMVVVGDSILAAAGANSSQEVQFINVSDTSNMSLISSVDVPGGNYSPGGIYYDQSRDKIFTAGACLLLGNSSREFLIIDSDCE